MPDKYADVVSDDNYFFLMNEIHVMESIVPNLMYSMVLDMASKTEGFSTHDDFIQRLSNRPEVIRQQIIKDMEFNYHEERVKEFESKKKSWNHRMEIMLAFLKCDCIDGSKWDYKYMIPCDPVVRSIVEFV